MEYDLYSEIQAKTKQLEVAVRQLRKSGTDKAQTERDYKILLAQEALKLRDGGMAIGMIDKIIYGLPSVAKLRFDRDVADTVYQANLESINSIKLQLRLLDAQISREWGMNTHD